MPYIANVTVKHNGKNYQRGAEVPLTDEQAAPLLALKAVKEGVGISAAQREEFLKFARGGSQTPPEGTITAEQWTDAFAGLDPAKDFTKGGTPKVDAVEKALGVTVTADQVAAAWKEHGKKD